MGARPGAIAVVLGFAVLACAPSPAGAAAPGLSQPDRAEVQRLGAAFADALAKDTADYKADLAAAGWFELVGDPAVIAHDKGLAHARAVVRQARAILARYRALYPTRIAEEQVRIVDAPLSEDARRAVLADFETAAVKGREAWDRQWSRDAAYMDDAGAVVVLLARTEGWWSIANGRISFVNGVDQAEFEAYWRVMERIAVAETISQEPFVRR